MAAMVAPARAVIGQHEGRPDVRGPPVRVRTANRRAMDDVLDFVQARRHDTRDPALALSGGIALLSSDELERGVAALRRMRANGDHVVLFRAAADRPFVEVSAKYHDSR